MDYDKKRKERASLLQVIAILDLQENYKEACKKCDKLVEISRDIAEHDGTQGDLFALVMAYKMGGQMFMLDGNPKESLPYFEKALEALKQSGMDDGFERQQITLMMGLANRDTGNLEEARKYLKESLELCDWILDREPSAANYEKKLVVLDFLLEVVEQQEKKDLETLRLATLKDYYSLPARGL